MSGEEREMRRLARLLLSGADAMRQCEDLYAELEEARRQRDEWMNLALNGNASLERMALAAGLAVAGASEAAQALVDA